MSGVCDVLVMRVGCGCGRCSGAWWCDVMLMVQYGSVLVAWWYDVMLVVRYGSVLVAWSGFLCMF